MAEAQKSLLKNSDSLGNIRSSLLSFGEGLKTANSTSIGIQKGLNVNNREKQRAILKKSEIFRTRRDAVQRKERESVIESGKLPNIISSAQRTISGSTKGFLGRIMDFVGTVMLGWLLTNLPGIIKAVQSLIGRIQEARKILQSWIDNTTEFFQDFTSALDGILGKISGILRPDEVKEAEDNEKKLRKGINSLEDNILGMVRSFQNFDLRTWYNDFIGSFGKRPGIDPSQPPGPGTGTSSGGAANAGRFSPILNLIGSAEGGYTSIAPNDENPNLTNMTIAEANKAVGVDGGNGAIGRYQLTTPIQQAELAGLDVNTDLFSPANQDKIAIALIKARGITADMIVNNPNEAAKRLAMEFAGIPVLEDTQGYKQLVKRGQSYYRNFNGNRATITPDKVEAAFEQFKNYQEPQSPSPAQTTPPPTIDSGKRYTKGQNVTSLLGKNASITSLLGASRKHGPHGGIDIGCDPGLFVSLKVDCEVMGSARGGGYGEVIDVWVESLGVQLRFAHSTRHIITSGKIPAGTSFTVTGYSGTVDPPGPAGSHIHFEANTNKGSTTYGSNTSPDPYVSLIQLTSVQITGTTSPVPPAQVSAQSNNTSSGTSTPPSLAPVNKSRNITVPINPAAPPPAGSQQPTGGGPPASKPLNISSSDPLNRFMTTLLLTELGNT
jgi:hypothetical protein